MSRSESIVAMSNLRDFDKSAHESVIVWLIEDNEFYRHTIEDVLNQIDRLTCPKAFGSCEDALSALASDVPPDVVLLDIGLPGMDGIEGISRIKSITPSSHIIILTVHDDDDNVFRALSAGASGYLLKNSSKEKIIESINEVLQGGAPMNAQIAKKVLSMFTQFTTPKDEYHLTDREREILHLLVDGNTKSRIADTLYLSYHTVDNHIRNTTLAWIIHKPMFQTCLSVDGSHVVIAENRFDEAEAGAQDEQR